MSEHFKIAWMTDLHLDSATAATRDLFRKALTRAQFDCAIVTGDISVASQLTNDLSMLAEACCDRDIYVVLGNHDFYGSSFAAVEADVRACCKTLKHLHHLGEGPVRRLTPTLGLLGHRGWADARAGLGKQTPATSFDFEQIDDFRSLDHAQRLTRMEVMGRQSADYFRKELAYAHAARKHVIVATHFPPFHQSVRNRNRPCKYERQPFYSNLSAGHEILAADRRRPSSRTTVLCGHTHSPIRHRMGNNIEVSVGAATKGNPGFEILDYHQPN